jgi:hypothetical protein
MANFKGAKVRNYLELFREISNYRSDFWGIGQLF